MAEREVSMPEDKEALRELIQETAYLLDHERFVHYLDHFADTAAYELVARSRELGGKETVWWRMHKKELGVLLAEVPDQVRDAAQRLHLVSPIALEVHGDNASCLSHFAIFRTTTAGESHVYAVGHYEDSFVKQDGRWWYARHRVVVHTRMLEISTHVPF